MQRERETVKLRIPDTGTSWRRWFGNVGAWPVRGMHAIWRREAQDWLAHIESKYPRLRRLELVGHSRGAVVALYLAILAEPYHRHLSISLNLTGMPRAYLSRRWRAHYERWTRHMEISAINAHGDPVAWLPPFWQHVSVLRIVGPRRILSAEAHHESYIREHDN